MIQPRNTLVLVRLIQQGQRNVGAIAVLTNNDRASEAEVLAVGPGNISADGGRSETHDLKVGQRVLILHKEPAAGGGGLRLVGVPVTNGSETLYLYEQGRIIGIQSQPGETVVGEVETETPIVRAGGAILQN